MMESALVLGGGLEVYNGRYVTLLVWDQRCSDYRFNEPFLLDHIDPEERDLDAGRFALFSRAAQPFAVVVERMEWGGRSKITISPAGVVPRAIKWISDQNCGAWSVRLDSLSARESDVIFSFEDEVAATLFEMMFAS